MQLAMSKWDTKISSSEDFANALKKYYQMYDKGFASGHMGEWQDVLPKDIYEEIKGYRNQNVGWGLIGTMIWQKYVGNDNYNIADAISKYAEDAINDVITSLSGTMDQMDTIALRGLLKQAVFGDDGKLSEDEYRSLGVNIAKVISNIFENGIDISSTEWANIISDRLFGADFAGTLFDDMGDEYSQAFVDSYRNAIEAGFSDIDIRELWERSGAPVQELDNLGETLADTLMQGFAKALGHANIEQLIDWNEMWSMLDLGDLKQIQDYVNAGMDIFEIDSILENSESVEDFIKKLNETAQAEGKVIKTTTEVNEVFHDVPTAIKDTKQDIEDLGSAIETLENGEELSFDDLVDLASAHNEIYGVIGDAVALKQMLKSLKDEGAEKLFQYAIELVKSADVNKTDYSYLAGENIQTIGQLLDSLDAESEEYAIVSEYINKAATEIVNASKKIAQASEETITTEDFPKNIQDALSNIQDLDKAIETLGKGESISVGDMLSLGEAHNEIWEFIGDTDQLKAKLEDLRAEGMELLFESAKGYMENLDLSKTPFFSYQKDNIETVKQLMDSLDGSAENADLLSEITEYTLSTAIAFVDLYEKMQEA